MDHAIDDFTLAIARAPNDRNALFARAQLFVAKGNYASAIADYDRLLATSCPTTGIVQQQRQSAVTMQAELAKVHGQPDDKQAAAIPPAVPSPAGTGRAQRRRQPARPSARRSS